MKNTNPQELLNLWKKGKTLYAASFEFTAPNLLKKYNECQSEFNENVGKPNTKSGLSDIAEMQKNGLAGVGKIIQLYNDLESASRDLKRNLLNKIVADELVGLGYETPIKTSDFPQIIPLHVWPQKEDKINWDDSSFLESGINFLKIRIIKKAALKKTTNKKRISTPKIPIKDKKTGRPSLKNKIIESYEYLKKSNSIDYSKTLKSHTELIQETVKHLNPEITSTRGMQHEAIRRAISEQFHADKNSL